MDNKTFNKITKEIFTNYGFNKKGNKFLLQLQDVSIVVRFSSWRGVKSFNYYFSINKLYDCSVPIEERSDSLIEMKMEHSPSAPGYHSHEILFEKYTEDEYKGMLTHMLHAYFDPYKKDALKFLKENDYQMCLTKKSREFLNLA